MIQLHTLGEAVITVGDREVRPTSPTMFAALLYLGVERGQRVPRTALQELLFPDADERSGSHSLRQLLYKLRQLGAPIQAEGDVVWVEPGDVVDDVNGNGAKSNGNGRKAPHFLAGYAPRLSSAFDEWLEQQRSTVGSTVRRGLLTRMAARRSAADWPGVEDLARQVLSVDAFNEEATLALAEATALSGSKAEAVRILERYESEVGSDLRLPASVLRKRISERLPDTRRHKKDTPFVGREAEAAAMREAIQQLRAGIAGTVVIVGEPGIGKTRLLEEASALATLEGVNVQTVRCQPHYVNRPMGVFIELVPALLQCRGALGIAPEMLEHLQLLTSHRDDRANRPIDARDDSTRSGILLAAVRDLVDAVSSETPLLVAVEDAHWADATSLTELSGLAQSAKGRRVLLVHTTRALDPLNQAGAISDSATLLRLKPLVDEPMATLASHLLPEVHDPSGDRDLRAWCVSTAAGNPLYLQVLCAHYEETRQPFSVPLSMRAGIVRRIEQLPGVCRRLLEFSALLGRHASLEALRQLVAIPPLAFAGAIQRLESDGLLRTRDRAARISHDVLVECILDLITPLTRQALHSCVAANLEQRFESTMDAALLWDCADHWTSSGETGNALAFVRSCARHASAIGRSKYALDALMSAARLAKTKREQIDLLTDTMMAARASGELRAALSAARELKSLHRGLAVPEHPPWELAAIEAEWHVDHRLGGSLAQLLGCVSSSASSEHRTDAALLILKIEHEIGDRAIAAQAFNAVETLLEPNSHVYSNRLVPLIYHTSFGSSDVALDIAERLFRDLEALPVMDQFRAAKNLCVAWTMLDRSEETVELSHRYYQKARDLGLSAWLHTFALTICYGLTELERFDEAERWYHSSLVLSADVPGMKVDYTLMMCGVELALARNDSKAATERVALLGAIGDSARYLAGTISLQERVKQLDPEYRTPAETLDQLSELFDSIQHLAGNDGVAIALSEALTRAGRIAERDAKLRRYVRESRRETTRPPAALRRYSNRPAGPK